MILCQDRKKKWTVSTCALTALVAAATLDCAGCVQGVLSGRDAYEKAAAAAEASAGDENKCDVLPWTLRPSRNPSNVEDRMKKRRHSGSKMVSKGKEVYATKVLVPSAVSKVTNHMRPEGDVVDTSLCCWDRFQVAWDENGDPLLVSLTNFLCDPESYVRKAVEAPPERWPDADIHENYDVDDPLERKLRGNGFPGLRMKIREAESTIRACLEHAVTSVWPDWSWDRIVDWDHEYGLVSPERQPGGSWLDSQRLPHNDIKWKHGVRKDKRKSVPQSLATVLTLTDAHNLTGTTMWRTKGTKEDPSRRLSLLKTLEQNENGQGSINPWKPASNMRLDVNVREELPDPVPQSKLSHAWAEATILAYCRFNRIIVYDGRRLHNQYIHRRAAPTLSLNPRDGRLTMNTFYWQGATTEDKYHRSRHPEDYY